jgi:hypothetical protein
MTITIRHQMCQAAPYFLAAIHKSLQSEEKEKEKEKKNSFSSL